MHIEVKDPSLVERLRRLLPRPDVPFDEVLIKLLEQPCKLKIREIVEEVASQLEERIMRIIEETTARALGDLERKISHSVERAVKEALRNVQVGAVEGGGWEAVIREAMKRPDGCLTFAEIRRYYGKNLNSVMLRKRGFIQRERGLWCWPKSSQDGKKAA
jgi:arginyl-tRNA synthetase